MSKTEAERKQMLATLGLNPDAPALTPQAPKQAPTTAPVSSNDVPLAPAGVDPRTMEVSSIVFDPRLLDGFDSLEGEGMAAASRHVFALYKSPVRNKDRNSLLHRRIGEFIAETRRSRDTGGFVKETVKTTKAQRDLAAVLAQAGITASDLVALIQKEK